MEKEGKIFDLMSGATFKWEDLHGKDLRIGVTTDGDNICVAGLDRDTYDVYVLHSGKRTDLLVKEIRELKEMLRACDPYGLMICRFCGSSVEEGHKKDCKYIKIIGG